MSFLGILAKISGFGPSRHLDNSEYDILSETDESKASEARWIMTQQSLASAIHWKTFSMKVRPELAQRPVEHSAQVAHYRDNVPALTRHLTPYTLLVDLSSCDSNDVFVMATFLHVEGFDTPQLLNNYFVRLGRPSSKFPDCIMLEGPEGEMNLGPTRVLTADPLSGPWEASIHWAQISGFERQLRFAVI